MFSIRSIVCFLLLCLCTALPVSGNSSVRPTVSGHSSAVEVRILAAADTLRVCSGDGFADPLEFRANLPGARFWVTDEDGSILSISVSGTIDFESEGPIRSRIYAAVNTPAEPGDDVADFPADSGPGGVSTNYITVLRRLARTGPVATENGATRVAIDDAAGTQLRLDSTGTTLPNFAYLVTDDGGQLLRTLVSDHVDFARYPKGRYRIYGVGFSGNFVPTPGVSVEADRFGEGCAKLSNNYIDVVKTQAAASVITTLDGRTDFTTCPGGVAAGVVRLTVVNPPELGRTYLATDTSNVVLERSRLPRIDFSGYATGNYRIWCLFHAGTNPLDIGDDVDEMLPSPGNLQLTENFVAVTRTDQPVDGGRISGNNLDSLFFCADDPDDGFVELGSTSSLQDDNYAYVITTATDEPIVIALLDEPSFDFGAVGLEEVRVYAYSYTGASLVEVGTAFTLEPLSDGCYAPSSNFLTVFNGDPEAGRLRTDDLTGDGRFCAPNGNLSLAMTPDGAGIGDYTIVVIDAEGRIVLLADDPADVPLGLLPEGAYALVGVSYSGAFMAEVGALADTSVYAAVCYEVTADTLMVEVGEPFLAGTIAFADDPADTLDFCLLREVTTSLRITRNAATPGNFAYLLTDTLDRLLEAPSPTGLFPLTGLPPATYRIHGVAYEGELTAELLRPIGEASATGCHALSTNVLTVRLQLPEGGLVTTGNGETEVTIEADAGGGQQEVVFRSSSDSLAHYRLVLTDTNNVVLRVIEDEAFINFAGEDAGAYRVYGQSFAGPVPTPTGELITAADGCLDLSDNFVTVVKDTTVSTRNEFFSTDFVTLTVSPNPARGTEIRLHLRSRQAMPAGTITVYDGHGRVYRRVPVAPGPGADLRLPVGGLPSGVYHVMYATPAGRSTTRFVKL